MPANLTQQYLKAEEKYRQAQAPQMRIECLEQMLKLIPKHKGTDRLQGELRARLKELRAELAAGQHAPKAGKSGRIPRQGAGTAIVIGPPNAGKSRLLRELTSATPEVAPYPFTTRVPHAGMMAWEDIQIQLIDTPPIVPGSIENTTLSFIRAADLVVLCVNGSDDDSIGATRQLLQDLQQRKTCLARQNGFDPDDFSTVCVKTLCAVTRGEQPDAALRLELLQQESPLPFPAMLVELDHPQSCLSLRNAVAGSLAVIRIYTRRPGEERSDPAPVTLPVGATIADLAEKIHLELAAQLKFAKVWRDHSLTGKAVMRDHPLCDRDLVELY